MKSIPFGVGKILEGAIARTRRLRLASGLAITGIVWVIGIIALMGIDSRIVIFDDRIRYALTAGAGLLALTAALLAVVLPLRRRTDFRRMASILDARHPEHEERLMTLVELSETDARKAGFSASLFALVCDLAERDAAKVDLAREFPVRRTLAWLGTFAFLALALGVGSAVSPNHVGRLFVRAVAPWADVGNLFSGDIAVKPGDLVVLSGTVIRLEAAPSAASSLQLSAFNIRISRKTRLGWTEETSEPMANGVYETTADLNEREWRYRVTAGPAVTRYYHVRVSERPKYDLLRATVKYPDYTGQEPLVLTNDEVAAIRAVAGSRVNFEVKVSDPGTVVDLRIGGEPIAACAMVSNRTTNWSLDLVNRDGFRAGKGCHPLTSFVDQPPTVVIEKPTGTLRLPSHAKIPVEITAADDIAITSAYLRVSIDNEPWERHFRGALDLTGDRRFVRRIADVDLSLYDLIFAKNIRFDVVVDDACPPELGGPHSATSMPFTVQFAENESNYQMQELKKEVAEARRDIDEARKRLNDAQNLARQVRDELKRHEKVTESAERNGERLAHELDEAEKRIEELRNQFLDDERFEPLTRPMDRLLDGALKPTLEEIEKAQFRGREERAEEIDRTIPEMAKAVQELEDLTRRLDERAEKVDRFEKAKDLAARQEALAKAAKEILKERPADTAKLEAWKRLEEAAMRKAEELSRQKPELAFAEARRKMETASREMAALKRALDEAKQRAEAAKREAVEEERRRKQAEERKNRKLSDPPALKRTPDQIAAGEKAAAEQARAVTALENASVRRSEELAKRRAGDTAGAEAKAREAVTSRQEAAKAQRAADEQLRKGLATEGVKAMQRLAAEAAADAEKAPRSTVRAEEAVTAQREAAAALHEEQAIRADLEKGVRTAADLEAFDRALRERALEKTVGRAKARNAEAERARRERSAEDARVSELRNAVNDQKRAAEGLKNAAVRRAEEDKFRAAKNTGAAEQKAREAENFERQAAEAQRMAEDRMERGEALDGVKALQQAASQAAYAAHEAPQTAEKAEAAERAQRAAAAALARELAVREAIRRDELTREDLDTLDAQLKEGLLREASARTEAAEARAVAALAAAKEALGTEEPETLVRLAEAALETRHDAVAAERMESRLRGTEERTSSLREAENALEVVKATDAESAALEKKVLSLQQSAVEALERNDRNRALNLQRDIAQAQARATEAVVGADDAREAREAAAEAQDEAREAIAEAHRAWNNDVKAKAIAAQKKAIESERKAQVETRALRALDKIAASEGAVGCPPVQAPPQSEPSASDLQTEASGPRPAEAADAAADALEREVKTQAARLGMSAKEGMRKTSRKGGNREASTGGGVSDEVRDLAKELRRNDRPGLFKDLFSRLGWFRIRGASKDGLREVDLKDVPREYRDLVRRYFLRLSEEQP